MKTKKQSLKWPVFSIVISVACSLVLPAFALVDDSQKATKQQPIVSRDILQTGQLSEEGSSGLQKINYPEFAPGELIVKLKEGKTTNELNELNAKYNVISIEGIFKNTGNPEDTLKSLQQKLAELGSKHDSWYWQMDKDSKEYKDYAAKIEAQKEQLKTQIDQEEELLAHLNQRQARANVHHVSQSIGRGETWQRCDHRAHLRWAGGHD